MTLFELGLHRKGGGVREAQDWILDFFYISLPRPPSLFYHILQYLIPALSPKRFVRPRLLSPSTFRCECGSLGTLLPSSLSLSESSRKKQKRKKEKRSLRIILSQRFAISKTGGLSLRFAFICPKYKAGDRKQCSGLWTASNPLLRDSCSFPQTLIGLFADWESFSDCSQGKLRF